MDLPSDASLKWIVRRYATLLARDATSEPRKVVLPSGDFFPDAFDGDAGSVNLLFWRLQEHAALTDLDVELRFVDDGAAQGGGGGCGSGGCGGGSCDTKSGKPAPKPLADANRLLDGAYRLDVHLSDARNAVTLTSAMATGLAHLFVLESGGFDNWKIDERRATCEVAAVMLGFGVLLANASYVYAKGCHGVQVDRGTVLEVNELAVALALFAALNERTPREFVHQLDPTQREAFAEAKSWADSNAKLIKRLKRDPGAVAADEHLSVQEARPWLARVLGFGAGKKKRTIDVLDDEGIAALEATLSERKSSGGAKPKDSAEAAKLAELRALVDESFDEVNASRE